MTMIEHRNTIAEKDIRHVQEETLSNEHPNAIPPRPNHGRTLGIVGAICLLILAIIAAGQFL